MESLEPNELEELLQSGQNDWIREIRCETNTGLYSKQRMNLICIGNRMSFSLLNNLISLCEDNPIYEIDVQIIYSYP